eukprot:8571647-Alexandrium_andersonii.AAC.1
MLLKADQDFVFVQEHSIPNGRQATYQQLARSRGVEAWFSPVDGNLERATGGVGVLAPKGGQFM